MSSLKLVGRYPNADTSLVPKQYVDAGVGITQAQVDTECTSQLTNRVTKAYVDSADTAKVAKSYVDTQDDLYLPTTQLGAASGAAKLDASAAVTAAMCTTAAVGDVKKATFTGFTDSGWVSSGTVNMGSLAVSDPGYAWRPMCFGAGWTVWQYDSGDGRADIQVGTDSYGGSPVIAYSTGYMRETLENAMCCVMPTSVTPTFTGAKTFYIRTFRGFGTSQYALGNAANAWITIICMPV